MKDSWVVVASAKVFPGAVAGSSFASAVAQLRCCTGASGLAGRLAAFAQQP